MCLGEQASRLSSCIIHPSRTGNSRILKPSRFGTAQNQQRFGHPREVITYPCFIYIPGTNSPPGSLYAGPPTFTGATRAHCFAAYSAHGISHVKVTDICTSSASSNSEGVSIILASSSFGVAFVFVGNTRIILFELSMILNFREYASIRSARCLEHTIRRPGPSATIRAGYAS